MNVERRTVVWCSLFFGIGVAMTLGVQELVKSRAGASSASPRPEVTFGKPNQRWGNLEWLKIPLINPDEFFPDHEQRLRKPRWFFENYSESRLQDFLEACDLTAEQKALALDRKFWQVATNGCTITPPDELIWSLDARSRERIYSELSKWSVNYAQCYPYRFPPDGLKDRFKESGLPEDKLAQIRKLTYLDDGCLCLTDLEPLQGVFNRLEFNQVCVAVNQVPAYRLRLRVTPQTDLAPVVKYWGAGGREKLVKPLLESIARVPNSATISVSAFLPPFARLRLYTFPNAWPDASHAREDCFFTSLNFFNVAADTNFFEHTYSRKVLMTDYAPITDEPTFGDVVMLVDSAGDGIHACVYIAEDFVFTKNGVNQLQPWVIMKMSEMTTYFPTDKPGRLIIVRRKSNGTG